jgi:hypothetical protein
MTTRQPRYSAEETARRGDAIYERDIRTQVEPTNRGKVVAIDIDHGVFVIADNALTASERLLAQYPDAEIWCVRVGSRVLHRIGGRPLWGQGTPCPKFGSAKGLVYMTEDFDEPLEDCQ